jgi:hypothetical protein
VHKENILKVIIDPKKVPTNIKSTYTAIISLPIFSPY